MPIKEAAANPGSIPIADLWKLEAESYPVGPTRIAQGLTYFARQRVSQLRGEVGKLTALVAGSVEEPYRVTIVLDVVPPVRWKPVRDWLRANEMDRQELERGYLTRAADIVLEEAGLTPVPLKYKEMRTECSCADWMRPCKHILATMFAFGLELQHEPMALWRLRGFDVEGEEEGLIEEADECPREPLSASAGRFWEAQADLEELSLRIGLAEGTEQRKYLKRLGPLPFWGGNFELYPMMKGVYDAVRAARIGVEEQEH